MNDIAVDHGCVYGKVGRKGELVLETSANVVWKNQKHGNGQTPEMILAHS
jgi:hypothetical protein